MNKDQALGAIIFFICLVIAVGYVVFLFAPQLIVGFFGVSLTIEALRFWIIAVPVLIAFVAIMFIGAWIGWTMATTPPPKPIEELEKETLRSEEGKAAEA